MTTTAHAAEPKLGTLLPRANHLYSCQLEPLHAALAGWLKEHCS